MLFLFISISDRDKDIILRAQCAIDHQVDNQTTLVIHENEMLRKSLRELSRQVLADQQLLQAIDGERRTAAKRKLEEANACLEEKAKHDKHLADYVAKCAKLSRRK